MATISEKLQKILGEHYTSEVDAAVKKMIGEAFVAKEDYVEKHNALKAANDKIAELSADDWKGKYDTLEKDSAAKLAEAESRYNGYRLTAELKAAKVRNSKAVQALLDNDKIKFTEDGIEGLTEQLEALKTSDAYLFDSPDVVTGAGGFPAGNGAQGAGAQGTSPAII